MAVAQGFSYEGGVDGARVFKTTNGGKDWEEIYTYGEDFNGSVRAILMLN